MTFTELLARLDAIDCSALERRAERPRKLKASDIAASPGRWGGGGSKRNQQWNAGAGFMGVHVKILPAVSYLEMGINS